MPQNIVSKDLFLSLESITIKPNVFYINSSFGQVVTRTKPSHDAGDEPLNLFYHMGNGKEPMSTGAIPSFCY